MRLDIVSVNIVKIALVKTSLGGDSEVFSNGEWIDIKSKEAGKMETGVTRIREAAEVLRGQELNLQVEGHGEYFFFFFNWCAGVGSLWFQVLTVKIAGNL